MRGFYLYIDVVSSCNLSCSSCPVGNSMDVKNPKNRMSLEMLDQIMKKATRECKVKGVSLYNWTEPLLHPQLPSMIQLVQSYGVRCVISTNLNILKNPEALMEANPHHVYVSVSGWSQATYGVHHVKGDIEIVKVNLERLLESRTKANASTEITIIFHRYLNNIDEESLVRKFTKDHGVHLLSYWAQMMPMEKILAYIHEDAELSGITNKDELTISRLALPLREAIEEAKHYKHDPCSLLLEQITLNSQGNVALCCTVFDIQKYGVGNFLSLSLEEIQEKRLQHDMCQKCTEVGAHVYATGDAQKFDEIAKLNLDKKKNLSEGNKSYFG